MKRFFAFTLAFLLCLTLTACWDTENTAEPQDFWEMEEPPAEEPSPVENVKPDVFTLPYLNSQTFDPVACSDGVQQTVSSLLYEGLFVLDEHFEPQKLLCESYSVSPNGLTYTFRLRDAAFSNGAPLTASDVLATYRRAQASERYAARFSNIASMGTNRGALVVTLRRADSALPALLDIPIVKSGTEKDTVPLGTGPYYFLTDSDGPCLARKEYYWGDSKGLPARIALMPAKDADTAAYLFSAKSVHLLAADLLGNSAAASLGGVDRTDAPTSIFLYLGFNVKRGALADAELRMAINSAFDRDGIVETLLAGHAQAAQFPISPVSPLYPATLNLPTDSDAHAMSLSNDADGEAAQALALTLIVNAESNFKVALAEHLAKQLDAARVSVTLSVLPWAEYLSALQRGDFDLYLGEVRLTADWDVSPLIGTGGSLNYGGFASPELDKALDAFLKEENETTAAAFCERFAQELPVLPLVFKSVSVLTPEGLIDGVAPTASQPLRNLAGWTLHFTGP